MIVTGPVANTLNANKGNSSDKGDEVAEPCVLAISARNESQMQQLKAGFVDKIDRYRDVNLSEMCSQYNTQQDMGHYRYAVVANSHQQLIDKLSAQDVIPRANQNIELAMMFTGQGSQYLNMAQSLLTHPWFEAHMMACEASYKKHTGESLMAVIYSDECDGNDDKINQTQYTQSAMFAIEYSLALLWLKLGVQPSFVMGHSIGEYAAAVIAEVFSLDDAMKLVIHRGRLIQQLPSGGGMLAVRASVDEIKVYLNDYQSLDIAAINADNNVVLSGDIAVLADFGQHLSANKIKSTALNVSHAFHSRLMKDALADFADIAQSITYDKPQITFVSTVTSQVIDDEIATSDYWVRHISQTVLFAPAVDTVKALGANAYLEVGPQAVLSKMLKGKLDEGQCSLSSLQKAQPDGFEKCLAGLFSFGVNIDWQGFAHLRGARVALPNYPFIRNRHWVSVDPYFSAPEKKGQTHGHSQELANADGANVIDHSHMLDSIYQQYWQAQPLVADTQQSGAKTWLLVTGDKPLTGAEQGLKVKVGSSGGRAIELSIGSPSGWLNDEHYQLESFNTDSVSGALIEIKERLSGLDVIVYSAAVYSAASNAQANLDADSLGQVTGKSYSQALNLIQACVNLNDQGGLDKLPRLGLVTANSQKLEQTIDANHDGWMNNHLWGLARVVVQEYNQFSCINIDVQTDKSQPLEDANYAEQLYAELAYFGGERQICLAPKEGLAPKERLVPRLKPLIASQQAYASVTNGPKLNFDGNKTYLITGGLGALALKFAQWMVSRGAMNIVLLARREAKGDEVSALNKLQNLASGVRLVQVDMTDFEALNHIVTELAQSAQPLAGVFHFAGSLNDKSLLSQTGEDFAHLATVKSQAAWQLHKATVNIDLDYFIALSSSAALFGSPGQANYAAANAMVDGLCQYRRTLGLSGLSIQLGMVGQIGMAARRQLDVKSEGRGMTAITPEQFIYSIERMMMGIDNGIFSAGAIDGLLSVSPVNWSLWQPQVMQWPFLQCFEQQNLTKMLQGSASQAASKGPKQIVDSQLVSKINAAHGTEKTTLLETYLCAHIGRITEIDASTIDTTVALLTLGLDSLMLLELQQQIKNDFALAVKMEQLLKMVSVQAFSEFLVEQLGADQLGAGQLGSDSQTQASVQQKQSATEESSNDEFEEGLL